MDEGVCECLRGAACSDELQKRTERLCDAGHAGEALPALAERRMELLGELRACDQRLECIDRAISYIRKAQ